MYEPRQAGLTQLDAVIEDLIQLTDGLETTRVSEEEASASLRIAKLQLDTVIEHLSRKTRYEHDA